ncbi:MAG: histidine triad nucleotide-binding protein [Anaerolineae bacterium]|nr:histidine triad nucleotide-binding protein [Anaerolineae bacterium]
MATDCIFCDIVAGIRPATKVYETEKVLAFRDTQPVAPTHILIVPKKHIARIADIETDDASLMGELLLAAKVIAGQEGVSDGFRLVVNNGPSAGQSIFHIHLHLLADRRMSWPPG